MTDKLSGFKPLIELGDELSTNDVQKLVSLLNVPGRLREEIKDGTDFLYAVKNWENHNPHLLYEGLHSIGRADSANKALQYPWLACEHQKEQKGYTPSEDSVSIKSLVRTLKNEFSNKDWVRISLIVSQIEPSMPFEAKMKILVKKGYVSSGLSRMCELMVVIQRVDVTYSLRPYQDVFHTMSDEIFLSKFDKEIDTLQKEVVTWESSLKKFIETQNRKVQQMFDDEKPVDLESVYVPLTIIEEEPREVNLKDETTYSEIALMRQIAEKGIKIRPINFKKELMKYNPYKFQFDSDLETDAAPTQSNQSNGSDDSDDSSQSISSDELDKPDQPRSKAKVYTDPQIWCVIGNPGSGKSFLCHITALRFGKNQLPQFAYCLSIPCRNPEWHQMEQENAEKQIDGDFIAKWMCLSMPIGPTWTSDLAKHILESDGEGLLLIIDSLDEFTKEVPFEQTILFLLLTRKALSQSTILITSRPGAYTVISSSHFLLIDRFFQVLGFSPKNRDRYFRIQLKTEKLKQLKSLIHLHEEMNLLSLIPVNASLFAALIRGTENITAFTLTQLYSELITYLVRRQLFRMNLKEWSKKTTLFLLPPPVLDCLFRIGEAAYMGVSFRELTSSTDILLKIGKVEKPCYCLGLAEEHIKKDNFGRIIRVWSFCHLTIQEFVGATWLSMSSWGDQCLSSRYIIHSESNFSVFKMVFRFLCGLLLDKASRVLFILFKFQPVTPLPIQHIPMVHQLRYSNSEISNYFSWTEFTKKLFSLSEMLFETSSTSIKESFQDFRKFLPESVCFYFEDFTPLPNEWYCFLKFLPLLQNIELLHIDTNHVKLSLFNNLIACLSPDTCSIKYLVLSFKGTTATLVKYCNAIKKNQLPNINKICLHLKKCDFNDHDEQKDKFPTSTFKRLSSLNLDFSNFPPHLIEKISKQLNLEDGFYCSTFSDKLPYLSQLNPELNGLHLKIDFTGKHEQLRSILSKLSHLQEISLHSFSATGGRDSYSLLPHLRNLTDLKYLEIMSDYDITDSRIKQSLIQIITENSSSLKCLNLNRITNIGLNCLDELLTSLQFCTNLIEVNLSISRLATNDFTIWSTVGSSLKQLLSFKLSSFALSDIGMLHLCKGISYHRTIKYLEVERCELSTESCSYLTHLIPTLLQLKTLSIGGIIIPEEFAKSLTVLKETAESYEVELNL